MTFKDLQKTGSAFTTKPEAKKLLQRLPHKPLVLGPKKNRASKGECCMT